MRLGYALTAISERLAWANAGWSLDRQLDGGEWSDEFHHRNLTKKLREGRKIARARLGMTRSQFNKLHRRNDVRRAICLLEQKLLKRIYND